MKGFTPGTYGDGFADVYDDWYGSITDAAATAAFVAARRGPGPVLELGVGSGRLVPALVAEGCAVIGVDASRAMLDRCRKRCSAEGIVDSVSVVQGDLGVLPVARAGSVGAALCAFNTLFNLPTAEQQTELLTRLARVVHADGVIVIEAMTGASLDDGPGSSVGVSRMSAEQLVLSATLLDAEAQTIQGQHVEISESGIRMRPWMLRWTTPAQLDSMAAVAGLDLIERFGDWSGARFCDEDESHISVYRTGDR